MEILRFSADQGVDGAGNALGANQAAQTFRTANTGPDVLQLVPHQLLREKRVCNQLATHGNAVHAGFLHVLLHELRLGECAHGTHGGFDVLFDFRRQVGVFAGLLEHTGVHQNGGVGHLLGTGGDMNHVHLSVDGLCDFDAGFQTVAALYAIGACQWSWFSMFQ